VFDKPVNQLLFKGLINNPKRITLLSDGRELKSERVGGAPWSHVPGALFITVPQEIDIGYGVIVKIELDEPIKLYTGESGAIEQN
jgi:alpha-L-fucosidase